MSEDQIIIIPCKKRNYGLPCPYCLVGDLSQGTEFWCSKFEEYGMGITKYGCDTF